MNGRFGELSYAGQGIEQDLGKLHLWAYIVLGLEQAGGSGSAAKRGGREGAEKKSRVLSGAWVLVYGKRGYDRHGRGQWGMVSGCWEKGLSRIS